MCTLINGPGRLSKGPGSWPSEEGDHVGPAAGAGGGAAAAAPVLQAVLPLVPPKAATRGEPQPEGRRGREFFILSVVFYDAGMVRVEEGEA